LSEYLKISNALQTLTQGRGDLVTRRNKFVAHSGLLLPTFCALYLSNCALPRWPVEAPVTSPFGLRLEGWLPDIHRGVDLAVPTGTEVHAMRRGTVEFAGTMSGYGNVIILRHGGDLRTVYGHLSELRVRAGDDVEGRQVIALSGATGNVTGPHLHFEIRRGGHAEDPVPLLGGFPSTTPR
jgi:murein DD-endopeptidase MepM/ murein hydrolase activator NlpD